MPIRQMAIAAAFGAGLAAVPASAAQAQYYAPCSPFPLFWPFCAAGAVIGAAATIVTGPFWALAGTPPYYYGYYGPRVIAERPRAVDSDAIRAIVVRQLYPSEVRMPHYVGLDVSQKTTSICIVNEQGRRLWRGVCATHPDPITTQVLRHAGAPAKVGIETGSMTPWLVHGLR